MAAGKFHDRGGEIKREMAAIQASYVGRSGRYSKADTEKMAALQDEYDRTRRFLGKNDDDPDAVSIGKKNDEAPMVEIAKLAVHHAAIPPLPRGKAKGGGSSTVAGANNKQAGVSVGAVPVFGGGDRAHDGDSDEEDAGEDDVAAVAAAAVAALDDGGDEVDDALAAAIQRFTETPPGHLKYVKDKIEPMLSREGKKKLLARENPTKFDPPERPKTAGDEWYHGAMSVTLYSPHHFDKKKEQMPCPICLLSTNVKANGWLLPGRRVLGVEGSSWIISQRLLCKTCKVLFAGNLRLSKTAIAQATSAQQTLQQIERSDSASGSVLASGSASEDEDEDASDGSQPALHAFLSFHRDDLVVYTPQKGPVRRGVVKDVYEEAPSVSSVSSDDTDGGEGLGGIMCYVVAFVEADGGKTITNVPAECLMLAVDFLQSSRGPLLGATSLKELRKSVAEERRAHVRRQSRRGAATAGASADGASNGAGGVGNGASDVVADVSNNGADVRMQLVSLLSAHEENRVRLLSSCSSAVKTWFKILDGESSGPPTNTFKLKGEELWKQIRSPSAAAWRARRFLAAGQRRARSCKKALARYAGHNFNTLTAASLRLYEREHPHEFPPVVITCKSTAVTPGFAHLLRSLLTKGMNPTAIEAMLKEIAHLKTNTTQLKYAGHMLEVSKKRSAEVSGDNNVLAMDTTTTDCVTAKTVGQYWPGNGLIRRFLKAICAADLDWQFNFRETRLARTGPRTRSSRATACATCGSSSRAAFRRRSPAPRRCAAKCRRLLRVARARFGRCRRRWRRRSKWNRATPRRHRQRRDLLRQRRHQRHQRRNRWLMRQPERQRRDENKKGCAPGGSEPWTQTGARQTGRKQKRQKPRKLRRRQRRKSRRAAARKGKSQRTRRAAAGSVVIKNEGVPRWQKRHLRTCFEQLGA